MDGITILYTYNYLPGAANRMLGISICAIMFLIFTISTFTMLISNTDKRGRLITGILALVGLAGFICLLSSHPISYKRYEVIIDDSVSFSEFSEKYEIIEVRGEIYTIEERVD